MLEKLQFGASLFKYRGGPEIMLWVSHWRSELRRRPKVVIVLLVVLSVILWMTRDRMLSLRERLTALPCADNDSKQLIEQVCHLYKRKEVVGDLCEPLCYTQSIKFTQCLNYRHGKHVVAVQCTDHCMPGQTLPAVLKMMRINGPDLKTHLQEAGRDLLAKTNPNLDPNKVSVHDKVITAESLSILTADVINSEFGYLSGGGGEETDLLTLIWGDEYPSFFRETNTDLVFARSFWSLLGQNEYCVSRAFTEWDVFPTIYSACGPVYLAEHTPPLKSLDSLFPSFSLTFPSWQSRAKLGIQILQLVERMDTIEHPLHLCDIKSPHFGLDPAGNVRFIDADTVYADEALSRIMSSQTCVQDSDCLFFDCEGACHKQTGKCLDMRTNNNLQVVCLKVFQGSALAGYGGLLSTPPKAVAAKLTALVTQCATETTNSLGVLKLKKPSVELLSELQRFLLESITSDPTPA